MLLSVGSVPYLHICQIWNIILNGAKSLLIGAEWNEEKVYNKKSQKVIGRTDKQSPDDSEERYEQYRNYVKYEMFIRGYSKR